MEQMELAQLTAGMTFLGFLMVRSAEQRVNAKGGRYLDMNLIDKTGEVNCKMWDGTVAPPARGTGVKIQAQVQDFNGRVQLKIDRIRQALPADDVDMTMLIPTAPEAPESMREQIDRTLASFTSESLRKIVQAMLDMAGDSLSYYPAAKRMHHAERSGLLHHTTDMLKMAERVLEVYPFLNADLLRAGVIIHDLGKIREMNSDEYGNVPEYSRDGVLVGHLVRGVALVEEAAKRANVTGEWVELLQHMVISHHGIPEYGSPIRPSIPEAIALHMIDTFDATMFETKAVMDRTPEGAFSEAISYMDGRRIYHPLYNDEAK
ncbi:MAG: HD domain-containing protein [Clostridia bacterium]|nr:HD domain-containing protein [Clostridia bacterium]